MSFSLKYRKIIEHHLFKDFIKMLFFGLLSLILGLVKFKISGLEGATSDFREIPFLLSIIYIGNPVYLVGVSFISAIGALSIDAFLPTFISHAVAIVISSYAYKYFTGSKKYGLIQIVIFWFFYVLIFYYILIIPLLVISSSLNGLSNGLDFYTYYGRYAHSARFEIISTTLVTTLYLIQYLTRKELEKHKNKLEYLVKERTEELETANEELKSINDELYEKSEIIHQQNDELKATLQNLKETQTQLIHAEKMASLGVLTSGVSHEINNPLNYIMGGYIGLERYFSHNVSNNKEVDLFLHSIKTGVDRATQIVKSLNQFTYDSGSLDELCNIHAIIDNCLLMLQNQLNNKVEIKKDFSEETLLVNGNISNLHQVFINIFTNSIQAIEQKGFVSIKTGKNSNKVVIHIKDSGVGINKEDISRITDPFFTTKNPGEGTGLGLAITASIVKKHNGSIEFLSEKNAGTTVVLKFPLKNE